MHVKRGIGLVFCREKGQLRWERVAVHGSELPRNGVGNGGCGDAHP